MTSPRDYPSQERLRELFDYDPDQGLLLSTSGRNRKKKAVLRNRYRTVTIAKQQYNHHKCVWIWHNGCPDGLEVDHINRNSTDDRIENLRLATDSQNSQNRKVALTNTSGFKGVNRSGTGWQARVMREGKRVFLGQFPTKEEAAAAYQQAAAEMHGEFAGAVS